MSITSAQWPPKEAQNGVKTYRGCYTSAGVGSDLTRTVGGRGITSITNTGITEGSYLVTFAEVGEYLLNFSFGVLNTAGTVAGQKTVNVVAYDASAKTMSLLVVDSGATPAVIDFATGDQLTVTVSWADSDQP